jgi:hypothetical protein
MTAGAAAAGLATRFTVQLDRLSGRPLLVAIAAMNAVTGLAAAAVLIPLSFGGDVDIFRRGSIGIGQGVIAQDFLYAPLFGLLATPLTWLPFRVASLAVSLVGVAIVLIGVALETRGRAPVDRALFAIAALGFLPVVYELVTGQVTLLIAASVYPFRDRDSWHRGIAFGVVLGLTPKPLLIPLLIWMLVYRRRALGAAALTAGLLTVTGVALLGVGLYGDWMTALIGAGQVTRHGNLALNAVEPQWLAIVLSLGAAVTALWVIGRREQVGFVASLIAAMLVEPYTMIYAASILLVAVRPAANAMPRATRWLSLVANPALLGAFVAWMLAALAACATGARRPASRHPLAPEATTGTA